MKEIKSYRKTSIYMEELKKDKEVLEIFFGKILGDGYLDKSGALRFCHSGKQKEYIEYCYKFFQKYTASPIKSTLRQKKESENIHEELTFATRSIFKDYLNIFYTYDSTNKRIKVIPSNIEEYITPCSLAFWIMDDGMKNHKQLGLCTHSFTKEENILLMTVLEKKFQLVCKLHIQKDHRYPDKIWYFIRIYNVEKVWALVKDYIIPSMHYKFGDFATSEIQTPLSNFENSNLLSDPTSIQETLSNKKVENKEESK